MEVTQIEKFGHIVVSRLQGQYNAPTDVTLARNSIYEFCFACQIPSYR